MHLSARSALAQQNEFASVDANNLKLWKVEIPDNHNNQLGNIILQDQNELLATRKILKYFSTTPVEEHVHIIVSSDNADTDSSSTGKL